MKSLKDKLKTLPPSKRANVKKRAAELKAEELTLRELRRALEITQEEMAERLQIGQDNISRQETRGDLKVSTLRNYVEALGGELSVSVRLPNKPPIELTDLGSESRQ